MGARGFGVDVLFQRDPALEAAVLDLRLLVDLSRYARACTIAGDRQRALLDRELERIAIDAGDLDDDDELGRVLRDEAVDRGPESVPDPGEAGYLPEVGEQLLDLSLQAVDVAPRHCRGDVTRRCTIESVTLVRRILKLVAASAAFLLYVWFAAVRAAPRIRQRKALRRAARDH